MSAHDVFDTSAARVVAWEARLEHLAGFVRNYRMMQQETQDDPSHKPGDDRWANAAVFEAVVDMVFDLGMVERAPGNERQFMISSKFRQLYFDTAERYPIEAGERMYDAFGRAALRSIIRWISEETRCGTSLALMMEMMTVIEVGLDFRKWADPDYLFLCFEVALA